METPSGTPEAIQGFVTHEVDVDLETWDDPVRGKVTWRTLISADRTPTTAMTAGVAELAPGASDDFHLHRHAQPEIYYFLEGEGLVLIDGVEHPVCKGSTVYVPGNAWHASRNTGATVMRLLYVFAVDSFDQVEYFFPQS